ncbi:GD10565 [Drosophila simulans]|uniref:alpha-glucosidase n=1 Tax=Drosophila simulans TaxID=7240 RepID=B4QFS4_DROSI|nr:GD10565 [Drosophila simulans]
MEDFENMVSRAKQLGVKIILDFVPNHSSDECDWFLRSAAGEEEYKDYYVWHPGFLDEDGNRRPPTNWVSVFRGSAWEWHEGRQEYYLHQFHKKQPDFNFRNPVVREEMNNVLRFWLEKGVDGFRVDAIYHAFEIEADENGNYPDEPRNDWTNDPDEYGYTHKIYTVDQPETPHLVYEWRQILEQFQADNGGDERILMVETWSPIEIVMHYYGNETADGAQIPFNFQLISNLHYDSDAYHYEYLINNWLNLMPEGKSANWVIGNHDKNRVGSRFGADRVDLFNILLLTLPGCSITYQGEELGMLDDMCPEDTVDPQAATATGNYMDNSADENGNYPDEPRNDWTNDPDEYGYTHKIYTVDQPETPHLVYEWRQILEQFQADNGGDERILMVETWSPIEIVMHYYGNETADGAQIPFNFQLISNLHYDSDAYHYEYLINNWLNLMPEGKSANWVIGNHDKNRVGSRFGADRVDLFNILLLTLPGCSITYQGEELGMLDGYVSWKDTVDPQACNGYEENYMDNSRDPARTPMHWSDETMAGFTTGKSTWLPVSTDYRQRNVKTERGVSLSHLNVFKRLQQLRQEPSIEEGSAEVKAVSNYVLAVKRHLSGDFVYISLFNIFDSIENVNLSNVFGSLPAKFQYALVTEKSIKKVGDQVSAGSVTLMPHEAIVLRSTTTA